MTVDRAPEELANEAASLLRQYMKDQRTDYLRSLATIVVELRSKFSLEDGRIDWAGRSTEYRKTMASVYASARIPDDKLDTVQAALRYHVGNLLRTKAPAEEVEAAGLTTVSPSQRLSTNRKILQASRETAPSRQDAARLSAYAQSFLDFIDDTSLGELPADRAAATRMALEATQRKAAELLVRLADSRGAARGREIGRPVLVQ